MNIQLSVHLTKDLTTIELDNKQGSIEIFQTNTKKKWTQSNIFAVYLLMKENNLIAVGKSNKELAVDSKEYDKVIAIHPAWDIDIDFLAQILIDEALEGGIKLTSVEEPVKIPTSAFKTINNYKEQLIVILENFGYHLFKKNKKKSAKSRHKWTKEVSQIEFFIDTRESKATVMWHKRNEMLIKAGATMMPQAPLNKDGSLGFAAKMAAKIRDDHKDQFQDFVTTEDIVLKSVNEVGLFLYFAGTNSWLEMIDAHGKTINEWTVVE